MLAGWMLCGRSWPSMSNELMAHTLSRKGVRLFFNFVMQIQNLVTCRVKNWRKTWLMWWWLSPLRLFVVGVLMTATLKCDPRVSRRVSFWSMPCPFWHPKARVWILFWVLEMIYPMSLCLKVFTTWRTWRASASVSQWGKRWVLPKRMWMTPVLCKSYCGQCTELLKEMPINWIESISLPWI